MTYQRRIGICVSLVMGSISPLPNIELPINSIRKSFAQKVLLLFIFSILHSFASAQSQSFTTPGTSTFTVPVGVSSITVECWGAGGGGSSITNNNRRGGGGGGGAYSKSTLSVLSGDSYEVIVGLGGSANTNGGNSSFNGTSVLATGGNGAVDNRSTGGTGGTGSTGTTVFNGGDGANGGTTFSGGGGGAAGSTGAGGNAPSDNTGTAGSGSSQYGGNGGIGINTIAGGNNGFTYGGGGSGARKGNWGTSQIGGTGANGLVIISYTYDPPSVSLSIDNNTIPENGGTATVTVTLSNPYSTTIGVNINIDAANTTAGGGEYSLSSYYVSIPPGSLTGTSIITAVDDTNYEGNETVAVEITGVSTPATENGVQTVTTTIIDDENPPPLVSLSIDNTTIPEEGGSATVTISLSNTFAQEVRVSLSPSGTANGGDYQLSNTYFAIPAGNLSAIMTITATNDTELEPNETLTISISTVENGYEDGNQEVTTTIIDDDTPGITINPISGLTTTEAGGTASFGVALNTQPTNDVTINLTSSNTNEGYLSVNSLLFTSSTWNTEQIVTITGVNDGIADGNASYTITTSPATSYDGNYNNMDADDVSVSNTDIGATSASFTTSTSGLNFGNVPVSSSSELSFTISGSNLTFAPDNITINATSDFQISLTSGSNYSNSIAIPYTTATLNNTTIYVRLSPSASDINYSENLSISGGGATAAITLSGNSNVAYCNADVSDFSFEHMSRFQIGTIDNSTGTTSSGYSDYTSLSTNVIIGTSYPITITNGDPYPGDQCGIWVDWNNDGDFEDSNETISANGGPNTFTATITPPTDATVGPTRLRTRILYTGSVTPCGTSSYGEVEDYTLNIINPSNPTLITSTNSIDFGLVNYGGYSDLSFTLDGINLSGYPGNITINAPTGFAVSQTSGSGFSSSIDVAYNSSTLSNTTIYIRFQPTSANTIFDSNLTISGGGATPTNIALSGNSIISYCSASGNCNPTRYISRVQFGTIDVSSACDGYSDFTAYSNDISLGASETITINFTNLNGNYEVSIWVDWDQDGTFNTSEEQEIYCQNAGNANTTQNYTISAPSTALTGKTRMRIRLSYDYCQPCGNEYAEVEDYTINVLPLVNFTTTSQSSLSESGTLYITAEINATSTSDVTVPFTVNASSTATGSGTDYTITASPIVITAGTTTADISVNITDDAYSENDETIIVQMGTPTNASLGTTTTHTITIIDDDPGILITETGGITETNESGSSDTFTIELKKQPTNPVVITITGIDASEGSISTTSLTFNNSNWDSPQTVTITGVDDALADGPITYNLTISVDDANSDDTYDSVPDQYVSVTNYDNECITVHPYDATVCNGDNTSFSILSSGTNYQWQVSTNGGSNWNNITAGGFNPSYSGYYTTNLNVNNIPNNANGYQYRCVVTGACSATSNPATLNVGISKYGPKLSASQTLVNSGESTTIYLSNTQGGVNYQLYEAGSAVGPAVTGNGGTITLTTVSPSSSTNYTASATTQSGTCSTDLIDQLTIIANEDDLIIELNPCAGQPGANFFTNSEFGTISDNVGPIQPGRGTATWGNAIGASYTDYTFGFDGTNEVNDGYYVITSSTNGLYTGNWMDINDNTQGDGTGHMYVVNASMAPGAFYTETLTGLCDSTKYEFSADIINLYGTNYVPLGGDYETWFPTDDQGNYYTILPNIDFLINGKVALNTGNIMNDGNWHTFGFTFRSGGLPSITLTMRNNSTGGIGNDLALDNIVMRPCGPEIDLEIVTTLPVCPGTPVTMTANIIASDFLSPVYQWQRSTDNGTTWNNISGATDIEYTENSPVYGHQYRYITGETIESLSSPSCFVPSEPVIILTTADIISVTDGYSCGAGTVNLSVNATSGDEVNWYDQPTGGTSLSTGSTYSPTLTETTTFYVDATESGCTSSPRQPVVATIYSNETPVATAAEYISCSEFTATWNNIAATAYFLDVATNASFTTFVAGYNNLNIGTATSYAVSGLNSNTTYYYRVRKQTPCGSSSSSNTITTITSITNPVSVSIAVSPSNTVVIGTSVTFTATPVNGGASPTYQWKVNGINAGTNSPTFTTTSLSDADDVTCEVTSSLNASCTTNNPATSNQITMNILPPGSNISGSVFNDLNAMNVTNKVDGSVIDQADANQLYAILINLTGSVDTVYAVSAITSGGYLFSTVENGLEYEILLTTSSYNIGDFSPAGGLPADWEHTGEIQNDASNSITGNDGTADGVYYLGVINTDQEYINFGIRKPFSISITPDGNTDCPDLTATTTPAFNPNNSSYNHGATEVTFRITPIGTAPSDWSFNFSASGLVSTTSSSSNITSLTLNGTNTPALSNSGTNYTGTITAGDNSYVELIFNIENTPGSSQNLSLIISSPTDNTTGNTGYNKTASYIIESMPIVGSFN